MKIALGLVHYPIRDRHKRVVATNITNLDVHDIARACRVFGIDRYYVIHPMQDQRSFVYRMLDHWRLGEGARYNPMRKTALTMVEAAESLEAAIADWNQREGREDRPLVVSTHARALDGVPMVSYREMRAKIEASGAEDRLFLIFGTGFGLTDEFMRGCDLLLEPIRGTPPDDYRHLSVRSAVSIILDRLRGAW
ncbi:MAG: RNA methyltransferase [Bdellovibrionales bacterium]|nr:RNA methyltransferase [Bdellovibrionales bacterium]